MNEPLARQTDPLTIFMQAENFALTYNALTRPEFSTFVVFTANPMIVLSAFASELFLKCLLLLEGTDLPKMHGLHALFDLLAPDTKSRITALWDADIEQKKDQWAAAQGDKPEPLDLPSALVGGGNAFAVLRYAHEGSVNLRFVLGDLPYVLRAAIIERKPEWADIKRNYREQVTSHFRSVQTRAVGHPDGQEVDNQ
jgi:hypothetical protein